MLVSAWAYYGLIAMWFVVQQEVAQKKKKQERKGKLKWIKQILVCLTIIVVVRVIKTVNRIIKFKWTKRLESGARKLSI